MLICGQKNSVEKKAVNLRKQAVTTKCRGYIYAEPKAVSLKKAVDFRALKNEESTKSIAEYIKIIKK